MSELDEMLKIARARMNYPQVVSVIVSPKTFTEIRDTCQPGDASDLGRMAIHSSEFVPDDTAIGRDHKGQVVKIWKLR